MSQHSLQMLRDASNGQMPQNHGDQRLEARNSVSTWNNNLVESRHPSTTGPKLCEYTVMRLKKGDRIQLSEVRSVGFHA